MKINSTCTVCGKTERVSKRIVTRIGGENVHTCDKCLRGHEWGAQRMTKKEIRQGKK